MASEVLLGKRKPPLRLMMMVSATGANLMTATAFCRKHPEMANIVLVVSDRPDTPALSFAKDAMIETWPGHFERECGRRTDCQSPDDLAQYTQRAERFHNQLCERVENFEALHGEIDLVVLAYHRWIHGRFLVKFRDRIINQHPGDLASLDDTGNRLLVGRDPVAEALRLGHDATRTTTFLVDDRHDGGALLASGPLVHYHGKRPPARREVDEHESRQKTLSDAPALRWVLAALAEHRLAVDRDRGYMDGSPYVLLDGRPLTLGGFHVGTGQPPQRRLTEGQ